MGRVSRDYTDGYRDGWHEHGYDPDRFWHGPYRKGMQNGRTDRIDDELIATYGDPARERRRG